MTDFGQVVFTAVVPAADPARVRRVVDGRRRRSCSASAPGTSSGGAISACRQVELQPRIGSSSSSRSRRCSLRREPGDRGDQEPAAQAGLDGGPGRTTCAPLYLVGWVDESAADDPRRSASRACSASSPTDFNATVPGLNNFPHAGWAPINLAFQVYHLMIDLGLLFPLIGVVAWFLWWRRSASACRIGCCGSASPSSSPRWRRSPAGGRPRSGDSRGSSRTSCAPTTRSRRPSRRGRSCCRSMFALLYALLLVLFLFLLNRKIQDGPEPPEEPHVADAARHLPRDLPPPGRSGEWSGG